MFGFTIALKGGLVLSDSFITNSASINGQTRVLLYISPNSSSKDTQGDRCPPAEKTAALEEKPRGVKMMQFAEFLLLLLSLKPPDSLSFPQQECCIAEDFFNQEFYHQVNLSRLRLHIRISP